MKQKPAKTESWMCAECEGDATKENGCASKSKDSKKAESPRKRRRLQKVSESQTTGSSSNASKEVMTTTTKSGRVVRRAVDWSGLVGD